MLAKIKLTILGSGTAVPEKNINPPGFLVEAGETKILLDAGPGTMRRLVDFGYNLEDIDLIFVSHFHTDHFGDAFNLVHTRWINDTYRGQPNKKLIFCGPQTIKERFKLWRSIFWPEPQENYPVKFIAGPKSFNFGLLKIKAFPVQHVRWFKSVGIIIKYHKKKIVYTGDIGSSHNFKDLVRVSQKADLLIIEAGYAQPTPNHYTIKQTKKLVEIARIKKVLIIHVRPQNYQNIKRFCRQDKRFIFGQDGLKIKV